MDTQQQLKSPGEDRKVALSWKCCLPRKMTVIVWVKLRATLSQTNKWCSMVQKWTVFCLAYYCSVLSVFIACSFCEIALQKCKKHLLDYTVKTSGRCEGILVGWVAMLLWPPWFQNRKEERLLGGEVIIFRSPAGIVGQGGQVCRCFVMQTLCQQVASYESHLVPGEPGWIFTWEIQAPKILFKLCLCWLYKQVFITICSTILGPTEYNLHLSHTVWCLWNKDGGMIFLFGRSPIGGKGEEPVTPAGLCWLLSSDWSWLTWGNCGFTAPVSPQGVSNHSKSLNILNTQKSNPALAISLPLPVLNQS